MVRNSTDGDPEASPRRERKPLRIDLALQGGGSRGAFTWGVLDRLLEETRLDVESISGASFAAVKLGLARRPETAGRWQVYGAACLTG